MAFYSIPKDFFLYVLIGVIATLIDWSTFAMLTVKFSCYYTYALAIAYLAGATFHYSANKLITFECHSRQLKTQLSVYIFIISVSLISSMGILALLISFNINKVFARILTTGFMLFPNFALHKYITFNKKIFT